MFKNPVFFTPIWVKYITTFYFFIKGPKSVRFKNFSIFFWLIAIIAHFAVETVYLTLFSTFLSISSACCLTAK